MKVVYFQAQTQERDITPMLREIDPNCPIPQALEGGDGNGGLWQCMIAFNKVEILYDLFAHKKPKFKLYSMIFDTTEVDDELYKPEHFVRWRWAEPPTVSRSSHIE